MSKKHKRKNKVNATGRKIGGSDQFLQLSYKMIKSPQFRFLRGNDLSVLMQIASRHNGFNNGRIGAGLADLVKTLKMGKSSVQKSLNNLQKAQFLVRRKVGKFYGRVASEWEVTFLKSDGGEASNAWGQAKPITYKRKPKGKNLLEQTREDIEKQRDDN